ncbi:GNAT family N-acetyltransferase [Solwaraspora sp. WMMB335]|uniref:GNAT family N-acetyltransferase n=1 Tax=Solwaraspora sp. WMMB335 TaxID=3404118 RepID=UPI003B951932
MRVGVPQDFDAVLDLLQSAFHNDGDPDYREFERDVFEPERSLVVDDGDQIVAHAGGYTRDLTVPGNRLPAAHVTLVAVAQTHRRRGLLTRMMRRQLRDIRDHGREPIAVLWASEPRIYPRFGYGLAAARLDLDIGVREVRLPRAASPGRLSSHEPATAQADMAALYERVSATRTGWSSRDDRWWRALLADTPARRSGQTPLRVVLHTGPDGVDGYAVWRSASDWDVRGPRARVNIQEVVTSDPTAYTALWHFLTSIDLSRSASFRHASVDEPLLHLVDDPRQLGATLVDGLWVRLVDVGTALAARRYAVAVDLVIDVTDALLPENAGRWHVTGDRERSRCVRTTAPADLACDVRDLGAVYLGGSTMTGLATAGRVRQLRHGALAEATGAFGWDLAPVGIEVF